MKKLIVVALLCLSQYATAQLSIEEGYVRGLPPGQPVTAAFMQLVNNGSQAVTIKDIHSDQAEKVEIHQSLQQGDRVRMQRVPSLSLAPGETIKLEPNGYHLMLIDLRSPLKEGGQVSLRLLYSDESVQSIKLPVRSVLNEDNHHHHHH